MEFTAIIILVITIVAVVNTIYSTIYKVVNMPSAPKTRRAIIDDIRTLKDACDRLNIYDFGSGWGGLCHQLQKAFPNANVFGIEISPIPFLVSFLNPFRRYKIKRQNLFDFDFSNADILVFYLSPYHMEQLAKKLGDYTKKGRIVYSQGFPIEGWRADKIIDVPYSLEKKLYRYEM